MLKHRIYVFCMMILGSICVFIATKNIWAFISSIIFCLAIGQLVKTEIRYYIRRKQWTTSGKNLNEKRTKE